LVSARVAGPRPSNASDEIVRSICDNAAGLNGPIVAALIGTAATQMAVAASQRNLFIVTPQSERGRGCRPAADPKKNVARRN
jgi:hypothetical protein